MDKFVDENLRVNMLLDYIINQGLKGNHILFDNEQIRKAFSRQGDALAELGAKRIQEVRDALREIFAIPGMDEKREFIAQLPEEIQSILVLLYFQILEKNILSRKPRPH